MYVILNVAIGGSFPGAFGAGLPTAATRSGVPMLVDYVAVYQTGGAAGANRRGVPERAAERSDRSGRTAPPPRMPH
jgi:hypothetical protein